MILFVGIGYFRKKRPAYAWFKKHLCVSPYESSTITLKSRPRST